MNSNLSNKQKELKDRLFVAERMAKRDLLKRIILQPRKMLYPKIKNLTNSHKEMQARPFWGGEMSVVIPEPVSTNIWRYGYFESDVCLYMLSLLKEGATFFDIGAHFGFFTLFASHLVGKEGHVLSFEPMPDTYRQLHKNITGYAAHPNVETHNCAAYNEDKELIFYDYGLENSAYNSMLGDREVGNAFDKKNEIVVEARKMDDMLSGKKLKGIDLIKIDAELSEIYVLQGLEQTLQSYKPKIIMEVGDFGSEGVSDSKKTIDWLQQMNYSPYEARNDEIIPHVTRDQYSYGNLLFVNEEE